MRLRPVSDLHLEFELIDLDTSGVDVLVLSGDTATPQMIPYLRSMLKKIDIPIVAIPGNHEYYDFQQMLDVDQAFLDLSLEFPHWHYLADDVVEIDGWKFIGATLWTQFSLAENRDLAKSEAQMSINDFRSIRFNPARFIDPDVMSQLNRAARKLILQEADERSVVITHFVPRSELMNQLLYGPSSVGVNPYYCGDLSYDCPSPLWISGHSHDSHDQTIGRTRYLSNPRGYHGENHEFDPSLTINL